MVGRRDHLPMENTYQTNDINNRVNWSGSPTYTSGWLLPLIGAE